jgi:hypothetical protein
LTNPQECAIIKKKSEVKTMSVCDRINCGYYYKGEDDDFPCCHCPDDLTPAPCEEDD